MKEIKYILFLLGTIIGAGFVTGKEIVTFFAQFGLYSIFFLIVVFILFYYLIIRISNLLKQNKIMLNNNFLKILFCFFYSVISGSMISAIIQSMQGFNINIHISFIYIIMILFCYFILKKGIKFLIKINVIIIPILIIIFVIICNYQIFSNISFTAVSLSFKNIVKLSQNSILYPSINLTISLFVFNSMAKEKELNIKFIAFIVSVAICLLLLIGILAICSNYNLVHLDLPFLEICSQFRSPFNLILNISVILGCVTTLSSSLYSLNNIIRVSTNNVFYSILLSIILAMIFCLIGFGNIVEYIYPVIGVLGYCLIIKSLFPCKSFFKHTNDIVHRSSKDTN